MNALLVTNGIIYLGGFFTHVGPYTGGFTLLDKTTGQNDGTLPRVHGRVRAIASDGAGGWYIGGEFTKVADVAVTNLVHIRKDKTVDRVWKPNPDGAIRALKLSGNVVFVAGSFTRVGGQERSNIAAVEPLTGQATPWNPAANFPVNAVAVQSNTVFLGGSFTKVGNQNRNCLAATDSATGRVTDWDPAPRGNFSTEVSVLLIDGETLYVGGNFSNISGQARENLASFSTRNGLLSDWNPGAMGWHVSAIAVADGVAYVGGIFGGIGGQSRANLAALNLVNGQATAWQPRPSGGELSEVFALAVSGNTVYAGGEFYNIDGLPRRRLAALDAVTGQATSWNPYVDGFAVYALADGGGSLAMGGDFRIVGGLERSNLAALDTATGKPISWNPGVDGFVQCMASSGDTLYVGGRFNSVGGQARTNLAALNRVTSEVQPWSPNPAGGDFSIIRALVTTPDTVYAGGTFTQIGGRTFENLAALDPVSGAARTWFVGGFSSEFGSSVHALALLDNIVYVGGVFTGIGVGARNGLAALDATTGTVTLWSPNPGPRTQDPRVGALRVNGDTLYVGGYFQMIGGAPRTNIAAVHLSTGTVSEWNPGADNQVAAVWPAGTTLFAGGTFETIGGQSRPRLAQLEVGNGSATAWNANPNSGVNALVADANTIYVGGDFSFIGGEPRMGFAAFGLAPPPRIETDSIQRLADGGLQFRVSGPSGVPLIVQGSIDFSEWVGLQTNTVGGVFDFTDGDALLPWRFYRALAQ